MPLHELAPASADAATPSPERPVSPVVEPAARAAPAWRWPAAALLGVLSVALRVAFEPWLGTGMPFVFAFPAVLIAALLAGTGPALMTVAVCVLLPAWPALGPRLSGGAGEQPWLFVLSALAMVLACRWLVHRAPAPAARPEALGEPALAEQGRHVEHWLRLLLVLALLLPAAFFISTAWQGRQAAFDDAEQRVTRSAVLAREHALKIMHMSRLTLERMQERFDGLGDAEIEAARPALQQVLAGMAEGLSEFQSLAVWGADGQALALSDPQGVPASMSAAGRDYFAWHREDPGAGLRVSGVLPSQVHPGDSRIVVSERRNGPQGAFAGVYAVALDAGAFRTFYRGLLRSEHSGRMALMRSDGTVIVQEPQAPALGAALPASGPMMDRMHNGDIAGAMVLRSPVDGELRLLAFRKLPGYPLYVASSLTHREVLAGWYRDVALLAAFTFPTAIALAWVSWLALRHTRREREALLRWRGETVKRVQAEDALRQTQRLEALGQLTGGVAHDVNNLLMVVSNNAYLLRRLLQRDAPGGKVPSRVDKPIDAILRAVTNGARLTRQLLAFSRRQALRPEVIRLQERMPQLLEMMRHSVPAVVSVQGEAAADTGNIQVDPAELELALINLAVNARDAMPDGGQLQVQVRNAEPQEHQGLGRWVSISVHDSGAGIAPELLARVFEPFFTTKEQGKGTGLGLSQVYGFCQQAGGTARIDSAPGRGTTVQLLLPAVSGTPEDESVPPPLPAAEGRLLLVEDNAEVAEATEPMLASWGYAVRAERSGDAALALLRQQGGAFELLLTDIVMPGSVDGLSLARHVRGLYPGMGIVLMTGHARETDKAMAEGFVVLQKPWTPQALAAALEQAHPRRRAG